MDQIHRSSRGTFPISYVHTSGWSRDVTHVATLRISQKKHWLWHPMNSLLEVESENSLSLSQTLLILSLLHTFFLLREYSTGLTVGAPSMKNLTMSCYHFNCLSVCISYSPTTFHPVPLLIQGWHTLPGQKYRPEELTREEHKYNLSRKLSTQLIRLTRTSSGYNLKDKSRSIFFQRLIYG